MKLSLADQIESHKRSLAAAKPGTPKRHERFWKLRELRLQQLRREIREGRLS